MLDCAYEGVRRVSYGDEGAQFVPVCAKCGRFVKAPEILMFNYEGQPMTNTATCSKCGFSDMIFEGYV